MSLFRLAAVHLQEFTKSKTTCVKHNCMSPCNITKTKLQSLNLSIRHMDNHKTVLLHSIWLEKVEELIDHKSLSLDMPNIAWDIMT